MRDARVIRVIRGLPAPDPRGHVGLIKRCKRYHKDKGEEYTKDY